MEKLKLRISIEQMVEGEVISLEIDAASSRCGS